MTSQDRRYNWLIAVAIIGWLVYLLAPVLNCEPIGVLLDGQAADVTGRRVAQTLGCLEIPIKARSRGQSVLEMINDDCQRHDWQKYRQPARPPPRHVPSDRHPAPSGSGRRR